MKNKKLVDNKTVQPGISRLRQSNETAIDFWTKSQRKNIGKPEAHIQVVRVRN